MTIFGLSPWIDVKNIITRILMFFVASVLLVASSNAQENRFYLKDGDRVVFYGDSITEQRLYTTFVETYVVTRWPELQVEFVNAGWSGDRVSGGRGGPTELRLKRDVVAYRPTVVTIMLGMNDGDVKQYDATLFKTFSNGYSRIVEDLETAQPGLRMTLIRPSPYDDVTREPLFADGYNAVLVRYGDFVEELAKRMKLDLADLNEPVVDALVKANTLDSALAKKIIPDRVHPGPGGHLLMAAALLKSWNAPALVSAVEIDSAHLQVLGARNATVSSLKGNGTISWTQLDRALPMPLDLKDTILALAVKASDVVGTLDQQLIRVGGLSAPGYILKIDGDIVGAFTKQSLEDGINLAIMATPMLKQAQAVHLLTMEHNGIQRARWREVQVPLQDEALASKQRAMDALDALDRELRKKQRATARPRPHYFELIPQS
jgi:lysophospholipase L1-like esterase